MSEEEITDEQLDGFLAIRKPGAHLDDDVVADDFVLMLGVDLVNYPKFSRVDDTVTYPKKALDIRYQLGTDSGAELADYSGPWRPDLRYTDFSKEALATGIIPWSDAYLQLCVNGWASEISGRYGAETMAEIEWTAWNDQVASDRERMKNEFLPTDAVAMIQTDGLPTKTAPMLAAHPCGGSVGSAGRGLGQGLVDVVDDVVDVLDPDGQSDRLRPDTGLDQLLVGQLAVGGGGRMDGQGLGVPQIK